MAGDAGGTRYSRLTQINWASAAFDPQSNLLVATIDKKIRVFDLKSGDGHTD